MFILLLAGLLTLAFNIQPAKASGTIYIRADGSIDPPDAPISTVDNITYTFTGDITDSIVIERDNIVVDGAGYALQGTHASGSIGTTVTGRSNVTIKNTNIKNYWYGINLGSSSSNSISGNNITNNGAGIYLEYSSNYNGISGNNITNNDCGIYLYYSSSNSISGNNITNNDCGIYLYYSSSNSISGNKFINSGLFVSGSYQNSVENNTVNGRPLVYLEGASNYTVDDAGQVILVKSENIRVEGLNLSRATAGVELWETSNSTISGNNITANNDYGIYLEHSSSNSISGNNITANNYSGIFLTSSSSNSISGNNIANNFHGILLGSSSNNSISGNNITANSDYGILLGYSSSNIISGNNITANSDYGILLGYSSSNSIFHNNFINNTPQMYSSNSVNAWDDGYPSGGNYWSDYTGVDLRKGPYQNETGSDGIGDTPYSIDSDNADRYPLMNLWRRLMGDVDGNGWVNVLDAIDLSTSFGKSIGQAGFNPNADFDGNGVVNILDAITLANHYNQHYP
jgi:parallel beta-helix repeat protein